MTTANDARKAHKILDDLFKGKMVLDEEREFLRRALPELPKQKTLEELRHEVYDAWIGADGNEWPDDSHGVLETWLAELHQQLQGLKDAPVTVPALPAGMRIADHERYGSVVTSPKPNQDGVYVLLMSKPEVETGADWGHAHECELTFIDAAPAKPTHPEFLETEADYQNAPEGTIAVSDGGVPCHKFQSKWSSVAFLAMKDDRGMSRACRRVLRWGK